MTEPDPLDAHRAAHDAFAGVLDGVQPEQLTLPTPCADWTVRDVINHVTGRNQHIGGIPTSTPDDLDALRAAYRTSVDAAHGIFAAPDGLTRLHETPLGAIPGHVFIGLRTTDALVHAWDIAVSTHQPTDLAPDVATAMLAMSRQRVTPELRQPGGAFGSEQPCPPNATPADQLAAFLGHHAPST